MTNLNPNTLPGNVPVYDVPEILRGQFDALCAKVVDDTRSVAAIYEADNEFGKPELFCYEVARFNRRDWVGRKHEKNLRIFLAHEAADVFTTVQPYEAELPEDTFFLPIATLKVPKGKHNGYIVSLDRVTEEVTYDESEAVLPDIVSYKLSLSVYDDRDKTQSNAATSANGRSLLQLV